MKKIIKIPEEEKLLRSKSQKISPDEIKSERIKKLKKAMKELLEKEKFGVAIAAPQVGELVSCFLISGQSMAYAKKEEFDPEKHKDEFFFNPEIVKHSKKKIMSDEGCLSVPYKYSNEVPRYEKVTVQYIDEDGNKKTLNASGFLARVLQHEHDHLQGVLYIDRAKSVFDVDEELRPVKK